MAALRGKKTYVVAGLIGLLTAAKALELVSEDTYGVLMGLLGGGGLVTLRAGITKVEGKS